MSYVIEHIHKYDRYRIGRSLLQTWAKCVVSIILKILRTKEQFVILLYYFDTLFIIELMLFVSNGMQNKTKNVFVL